MQLTTPFTEFTGYECVELYLIPAVMPSCCSQMQRQLYFRENNTDTCKSLFYEFCLFVCGCVEIG